MIKRIKESELPSLEDLDIEVLVIERSKYFEAVVGKYREISTNSGLVLNFLAQRIQGQEIEVKGVKIKIPNLRLL